MQQGDTPAPADKPHDWFLCVGDRDALLSTTKFPESVRHVAMRAQFVELMFGDPRIVQTVNRVRWRQLEDATFPFLSLASRSGDDDADIAALLQSAESKRFWEEYGHWTRRLLRALRRELQGFETPHLLGGFRWPWLLHDLGSAFARAFLDRTRLDPLRSHPLPLLTAPPGQG
jgi:hypothetical protein